MLRRLKVACAAAAGLLAAYAGAGAAYATDAHPTATALPTNWYAAAPYLMPADNNPPDPATIMDATGQKAFQLAFILAKGSSCTPAWDGTTSLDDATSIQQAIDTIRGKGGDVSVSVGGYAGTKLGQTCSDAASTAAAYQQVVDTYGLHAIDFDLEEPEYENSTAIAHEVGAAKILQHDNPGLYVSITMPGTPAGTGWFGTQLLDQISSIGFVPSNISIMPFDNGFNGGSSQVSALEAFHGLLESHLGWDSDFAYQHEGFSGMNGRTDAAEYFRQADFQTVLDYALAHQLGRYTFWSANRDRECDPPENGTLSGECSSVTQQPWEFTTYTTAFAHQTSVVDPPTTPPTTPPGDCTAPAWNATTVYVAGDQVSYQGHTWQAKWWTQGQAPDASQQWGPWADKGACTSAATTAATTTAGTTATATTVSYRTGSAAPAAQTCPPAWDRTAVYVAGDTVSYQGDKWTAKWWTQGQTPDASQQWGPWRDDGPCGGGGTSVPGAPSDLTVTGHTASSVSLAWTAPSGTVTGYNVYQGDTRVASTTDTTATVSGLSAGTTYTFTVTATNSAGESAHSASVSATTDSGTPTNPPAAPTGLTKVGVTDTSASLSWTAPSGTVDSYNVYEDGTKVDTTTGTSTTVTGLTASTTYTFAVTAVNAAGESPRSATLSVTTSATTPPGGDKSGYINGTGDGKLRVMYFDQWSIYQNAYYLKDIDSYADDLDYLIYDFENIDPTSHTCFETTKATDPDPGGESDPNAGDGAGDAYADYQKSFGADISVNGQADTWNQPIVGNFNQLKELKARHPNLKVLLSIGGWTYSKYFSDAAATDASRQKFVSSCIDMFIKGNIPSAGGYGGPGTAAGIFDGFDIDWEYPASDTGHVGNHYSPNDTANYTKLLAEFRSELDAQGAADGKQYALSAALPGGQDKVSKIETDKIGQYLTFGDVMTYDMHGAWDATGPTNLQDPLFPSADDPSSRIPGGNQQYDSDTIMKAYTVGDPAYGIPGGFPANKLTLGIPMYYRGWTGVPAGSDHGEYSSATGPSAPHALSGNVPGIALQKELDSLGFFSGGKEFYDSQRMAGWYYDGTTFYAGSTPQSIKDHLAYAKCNGLGGVMIFSAYDETPTSQPLLEDIINDSKAPKPSDCSTYATDTWGVFGPPATGSATHSGATARPANPAAGSSALRHSTPATAPEQRRRA